MARSSDLVFFRRATRVLAAVVVTSVASMTGISAALAATTVTPDTGYAVSINQGNLNPLPTASGFENHSCDEFTGKAGTADGWLFVASPDSFTSFEAVFDQGTVFYNDPQHRTSSPATSVTPVPPPTSNEHLAVVTPAGWTLQNAYANLSPANDKTFFTLSHTCPATQDTAPAPTASFNDSCDLGGIVVTLGNTAGTAAAHFTVTYGGTDHTVDVPAGASSTVQVPVTEDTTGNVTVNAPGLPNGPVSHSWARNCTDNGQTQTGGQTAAAPTASLEHSCAIGGIRASLGNVAGTAPADFTLHYGGADHAQQVAAGATATVTVPVAEDTTETVTVSAPGLATQSDTFARDCTATVPAQAHGVNPAVTFANACTSGITATLSNMALANTTTDAVTFTVTTPTGATEQVVVGPDQITKRSYDFANGTTGVLSVQAPGLAKQTTSYAKSCTSVLGEKLVNGGVTTPKTPKSPKTPTPAVQGDKTARQLPMTGAATGSWLQAAVLLLVAGSALALAGRKPYRPRHAAR